MTAHPISSISLHYDYDLVAARRRARQVSALLGFDDQEQTRIATVVSEIARNALRYGGGGRTEFGVVTGDAKGMLTIQVSDRGPGIANLDDVLNGRYRSATGMGLGILGARRLMDGFAINSSPGNGTIVRMQKTLPPAAPEITPKTLAKIVDELARQKPENPLEEIQQQNVELLQALASLNERQDELQRLNQELEDTNRGVLALYAQLDEQAESLRHADQLKSRFLSDMSHEFRTPVNSILALTRLLDETELPAEGKKQVSLIRRAADDLATLVNDLLDIAKIEAGKVEVRPADVDVANLFSALRGMLRPLLLNRSLALVFDETEGLPPMYTDEGKVSQILRNFISNALKFTESGEVRVSASMAPGGESIVFSVTDTGIGIAPQDQERIFEEFAQLDTPHRQNGVGLGLPLTRKLAKLLGGTVGVKSEVGIGSTFWADLPLRAPGADPQPAAAPTTAESEAATKRLKLLLIDDDEASRYAMSQFAKRPGTTILDTENGHRGIELAKSEHPDLVLLDLMMPVIGGHEVLSRLKADPTTEPIPVIVVTSRFINDDERRQILARATAVMNKADLSRELVLRVIDSALAPR